MDKKLKILAVVVVMAGSLALDAGSALADTDGFIVHCVNVTIADPRFFDCDDQHPLGIQNAVNHAESGETVFVGAGTYNEQVTIIRPLTLEGAGMTLTTIRPSTVTANTTSITTGDPIAAIILVDGVTGGVEVSELTVDGSPAGATFACAPGYVGIYYRASSGAIEDTQVANISHPAAGGCQIALGIFVQTDKKGKGKANVTILDNTVNNYGKNGITANQAGTFVTVNGNTVVGRGQVADAAQNGVQVGFGARGRVSENSISNNFYTPPDFIACGLLFFQAGGGIGRNADNTFANNEQNICNAGGGPSQHSPFNQ